LTDGSSKTVSDEIAAFLGQGLSFLVGTCDARHVPECTRAVGLVVHDDRATATVYLPEVTSTLAVANLRENMRIALVASYPLDHRSLQLKGRVTAITPADEAHKPLIERYLEGFSGVLELVGMPPEVVRLLSHWPSVAVTFAVDELYDQTPGPGAGARLLGGVP
jgi:hypothetical protein